MALRDALRRLTGISSDDEDNRRFFNRVYRKNFWGGKASRSGAGSEGAFAEQKVTLLLGLVEEFRVGRLLDIGCGDVYWMSRVMPRLDRSCWGRDRRRDNDRNRRERGSDKVQFLRADLSKSGSEREQVVAAGPFDLVTALCDVP